MLIKKIAEVNLSDLKSLILKSQVIVFPTETAYGLVADATDQKAVEKIYKIKGRGFTKPLPVVCSSLTQVKEFFILTKQEEEIGKKYWPGPLAIKVKQAGKLKVNTNDDTVVVRVTGHKFLSKLADLVGKPLVATSANISGKATPYSIEDIKENFAKQKEKPDLIVDAGKISYVEPSTIIEIIDNQIKVLRKGPIKIN